MAEDKIIVISTPNSPDDTILKEFYNKLINNQEELDPKFQKVLDEHFWDLLEE